VQDTLPTYRAELTFPPGLDETRLTVFDERGERAAATTWRPSTYDRPGPVHWDWRLNVLHYARTSPWQPDGGGFGCDVKLIFRDEGDGGVKPYTYEHLTDAQLRVRAQWFIEEERAMVASRAFYEAGGALDRRVQSPTASRFQASGH
jgi:hypothetical protein